MRDDLVFVIKVHFVNQIENARVGEELNVFMC